MVLVIGVLVSAGCSMEQSAELFVRRELLSVAKDFGVEISELTVKIWTPEASITDKAMGIQARTFSRIEFLARCNEADPWAPASLNWLVIRKNNEWFSIRDSNFGRSAYVPWVASRVELPYLLPPCNIHVDPGNWEEKLENRRLLERWDRWMKNYIQSEPGVLSPLRMGPNEAQMLLLIGPSWPFTPERKVDLELWFGRTFADKEIQQFRTDPDMQSRIVTMIAEQESQDRLGDVVERSCGGDQTLAEFYGMALDEQGRQVLRRCADP